MHIFNKAACGLPLLLSLMSTNGWATTLAEALSAAENYSAELSANDHQVNALKNMADSAMQLPDPKLKFGIENVPLGGNNAGRLTREGMTMQRVGVMQDYVSSTKRERKADSITAEARQTAANADVIRARLQRETAQAWLALALEIPLTVYYISIGDALYNLIVGGLMAGMLWLAIRGIAWQRRQPEPGRGKLSFHLVTVGYILLENCLWLSSYPWMGDTLANPYFWFDFAVTASLVALFPAVRKAVRT